MSINSEKYHFADFTHENYRKLLVIARERYQFVSFSEFDTKNKDILWRHDVDISMHAAKKLAFIEKEEGVKATYFLLLHSEFYNLLEIEIYHLVKEIISFGHDIGLHFYSRFYNISNEIELVKFLEVEKTLLETIFSCQIKTFSFHNPETFELNCTDFKYAGMINTYAKSFQENVAYCSDSNGFWRHKRLENFLTENNKSAQVLTHPEWWTEIEMSPTEKVKRSIVQRAEKIYSDYKLILQRYGRENIDW